MSVSLHHNLCAHIAACELESGAIYPATFPDKGPDTDIRAAGLNVQDAVCGQHDVYLHKQFLSLELI